MCKLWAWPWRYDPESKSWYHCVIHYQYPTWQWGVMARARFFGMFALWPWHQNMTLGQGHDTSLGHWQQLCEILSISNLAVRSYNPDKDFGYVCTVTLTLEVWPLWCNIFDKFCSYLFNAVRGVETKRHLNSINAKTLHVDHHPLAHRMKVKSEESQDEVTVKVWLL